MIELKIEGMSCGHCAKTVERALASVPGVDQVVEVSVARGAARIEGKAEPAALIAAVEDEGYRAWQT